MFKTETGAQFANSRWRAPFNAVTRDRNCGMLIELLETRKLFNAAGTRNRVKAFLDK